MMKRYPQVEDLLRPLLKVAMPRAGRLYAPGGTVHVVARCNNREFYPKVRQRQYRTLLAPSPDPRLDTRDPRWTTQRAVGSPAFLQRYIPPRGRRKSVPVPPQIQALGA
jgi:hypothetical protein